MLHTPLGAPPDLEVRLRDTQVVRNSTYACSASLLVAVMGAHCDAKAVTMRGNILIVDDDKDVASLLAEILHRRGFETGSVATTAPSDMITMAEMEERYPSRVLAIVGGNKSEAARVLGIDRRSLYRRLQRRTDDRHARGEPRCSDEPALGAWTPSATSSTTTRRTTACATATRFARRISRTSVSEQAGVVPTVAHMGSGRPSR